MYDTPESCEVKQIRRLMQNFIAFFLTTWHDNRPNGSIGAVSVRIQTIGSRFSEFFFV